MCFQWFAAAKRKHADFVPEGWRWIVASKKRKKVCVSSDILSKKIPKGVHCSKAEVKSFTEKSSQTGFVINGHNRKMASAIADLFPWIIYVNICTEEFVVKYMAYKSEVAGRTDREMIGMIGIIVGTFSTMLLIYCQCK